MNKEKKLNIGCIAFLSPVIFIIISSIWFCVWYAVVEFDEIWVLVLSLLPFAVSPVLCLVGIVYGVINVKSKVGRECILLCLLGLAQNIVFFCGVYYVLFGKDPTPVISWR